MNLLGGYGSDSGESGDEEVVAPAPKKPKTALPPATGAPSSETGTGKRKIDFSKLPVRRPVVFDDSDLKAEEAPLKAAAALENLRGGALSLLAALPAPKVTLGLDCDGNSSGSRLDLSEMKIDRPKVSVLQPLGGIMRNGSKDIAEDDLPKDALNHPMFRNDGRAGAGGDTPGAEELHRMREMKFKNIKAEDVQDPNWYMNSMIAGGAGGLNKKVALEVSGYEAQTWQKTTHANPSKNQKKKNQINYLAQNAMEMEAEMLERNASSRLTKSQTSLKYGW